MQPETVTRVGDWIQTYTGRRFWPLDPRPEDVEIIDIAHALSNICRFTGHVRKFYSVAEHSVHVSYACDPADALWGLVHDASEAYISDISRPLKRDLVMAQYRHIEHHLQGVIARTFGLDPEQPASVSAADKLLLGVEARDLMSPLQPGWEKWVDCIGSFDLRITDPWTPGVAEDRFKERFLQLVLARDPKFKGLSIVHENILQRARS